MRRLIAIGDIHGHHDLLVELITSIAPNMDDQLVFLGDYVDRGPESAAVVDWMIDFKVNHPQTVFLRGNHEQMLLDAIAAAERKTNGKNNFLDDFFSLKGRGLPNPVFYFLACGGLETLQSYHVESTDFNPCSVLNNFPERHLEFLHQTQFYWHWEHFMFVHAGVDPKDMTGEKKQNEAFLWQRKPLWKRVKHWNKVVVHGHTPVNEPYFGKTEINLDTGAGFDAQLTACDVLSKQIWQTSPAYN